LEATAFVSSIVLLPIIWKQHYLVHHSISLFSSAG